MVNGNGGASATEPPFYTRMALIRAALGLLVCISSSTHAYQLTEAAKDLLGEKGYDPHYGARPLKRVIQRMLQDPLAMRILEGEFPEGSKLSVDARVSGEALEFRKV